MKVAGRVFAPTLIISTLLLALSACGTNQDGDDDAPAPPPEAGVPSGTTLKLALLETSDLHANVLGYDYYRLAEDPSIGTDRAATLIKQARGEFPNTLLFDNGDTIQGTVLSDYQALVKPVQCGTLPVIYQQLEALKVDAAAIGNHEFNYGLPYLSQVTNVDFKIDGIAKGTPGTNPQAQADCAAPSFPFLSSNVLNAKTQEPIFQPWTILPRTFTATAPDGSSVTVNVNVGVIAFTPPSIMTADKRFLDGHVTTTEYVAAAQKYVPQMQAQGADVIVALAHSGITTAQTGDNAGLALSSAAGFDAMLFGHQHQKFPDPGNSRSPFAGLPGVDPDAGTLNGVPAAMPGFFGSYLGVIELTLAHDGTRWSVRKEDTRSSLRPTLTKAAANGAPAEYVASDSEIAALAQGVHEETIQYVQQPIGETAFPLSSDFAAAGDVSSLQIVNMAQIDYVERYIQDNNPEWGNLPVLSAAAPFRNGFYGVDDYIGVETGQVSLRSAADLYTYSNTVNAVRIDGKTLRLWLENAAGWFNRIDASETAEQTLINESFPSYNFDVMQARDGKLRYTIDISVPAYHFRDNPTGRRITTLEYDGVAVQDDDRFIVATNSFRAGAPYLAGVSEVVLEAPDTNRDALIKYVEAQPTLTLAGYGADRSWSFAPMSPAGDVVFMSSANATDARAQGYGITNVSRVGTGEQFGRAGYSKFSLDLR
ncbi:2',3'-cyclic-nucleotide 2'-phosphodiesterase [plant metagenome]|uniref:2',3'-cyclic-nucleotide 2'-phosphodiesterase n=1 Tax=plant metagenome TaxID=1297885 RepID=A0A484Q8E8_9ZZZZ